MCVREADAGYYNTESHARLQSFPTVCSGLKASRLTAESLFPACSTQGLDATVSASESGQRMCTAELAIRCLELQDPHPPSVTPQSQEDVALGLPAAPLLPTVYYVEVADFDGTRLATTAKRVVLEAEPPAAATGVPVGTEQCICQRAIKQAPYFSRRRNVLSNLRKMDSTCTDLYSFYGTDSKQSAIVAACIYRVPAAWPCEFLRICETIDVAITVTET